MTYFHRKKYVHNLLIYTESQEIIPEFLLRYNVTTLGSDNLFSSLMTNLLLNRYKS